MKEIEIGGHKYSIRKLPLIQQFHISRKLTPYIVAGSNIDFNLSIMAALARLPDSDSEYVVDACMAVTQIKQETQWSNIGSLRAPMFEFIAPLDYYDITAEVIEGCLANFFTGLLSKIAGSKTSEA